MDVIIYYWEKYVLERRRRLNLAACREMIQSQIYITYSRKPEHNVWVSNCLNGVVFFLNQ